MRFSVGPVLGLALLASLTSARADVPAARFVRAMPSSPGVLGADGRMPVLVELPRDVRAEDVGVFPLVPGFGAARLTPDEVLV